MSDTPHMTYVFCDDWCGLYRNGRLVYQSHSLPPVKALQLSGVLVQTIEVDDNWVEWESAAELPPNLGDIPPEARVR